MNKDTFCAYPFNTIFLGSDGKIKPCCSSSAELGDINTTPIKEIINGPLAREIRESIVNETWHATCGQCYRLEKYGARTERTGVLYKFDEFKEATADTFVLQKLDFRWSNTCNLACNYCYEYFSSQWSNIKGIKINSNKDTAEKELFALIDEQKGTIENINLLGGEPLLQKQNQKLFDLLPDKGYYILTNLSLDLKKNQLGQKLISMPNVNWGVSFENIGLKYEHVRHGAKWEALLNNLEYLKVHGKQVNAHPLYCAYSAFDLLELYDWYSEIDVFTGIYWCAIQNLPGQNVFTLPNDLKKKAITELENVILKYENSKYAESIESIKEYHKTLTEDLNSYNLLNDTGKAQADFKIQRDKKLFLKWIDEIENNYLTKEYTFRDLWPEVYNNLV
jgi:MoaA/NifB/PqqE/SkfB family radical SAM enzyme